MSEPAEQDKIVELNAVRQLPEEFVDLHRNIRPADVEKPEPPGFDWDAALAQHENYSKHHFYVHSTDDRDKSEEIRTRHPKTIVHALEQIVQQRLVPAWRTKQDAVRDALVHRMHEAAEISNVPSSVHMILKMERLRNNRITSRQMTEAASEEINGYDEEFARLREVGDVKGFRLLMQHAREEAESMDEPWRSKLLDKVKKWEG